MGISLPMPSIPHWVRLVHFIHSMACGHERRTYASLSEEEHYQKSRNVTIRFDEETYDQIQRMAHAADLSVSEYIRRMVVKGKVTVR